MADLRPRRGSALVTLLAGIVALNAQAADIDALWEYADPAASEQRFRAALASAQGDERLELLTQIARTHSLRKRFDEAHRVLDEVQPQLDAAGALPRLRYLLERGRSFNSAGERERARTLFEQAFELGRRPGGDARLHGLTVDAAHMVAITLQGSEQAIDWNRRALEMARASPDAKGKALIPALLNNLAWDLHDRARFAEALPYFEQALAEWSARGRAKPIHIARWSVARCLRSLGRFDDALAIQRALHDDGERSGQPDGFVFEELAENLLALGRAAEARPHFARAAALLGQDADWARNEAARLERLRRLGAS